MVFSQKPVRRLGSRLGFQPGGGEDEATGTVDGLGGERGWRDGCGRARTVTVDVSRSVEGAADDPARNEDAETGGRPGGNEDGDDRGGNGERGGRLWMERWGDDRPGRDDPGRERDEVQHKAWRGDPGKTRE